MPLPPGDVRVSRIRHEPGAHTIWHVHKGGQVIYVESGRGLVQKWGGEVQEMSAGDIIYTAAGEKHWHGAAPDSRLTIVATSLGETEWLEPVQPAGGKQPGRVTDSGHGQSSHVRCLAVVRGADVACGVF